MIQDYQQIKNEVTATDDVFLFMKGRMDVLYKEAITRLDDDLTQRINEHKKMINEITVDFKSLYSTAEVAGERHRLDDALESCIALVRQDPLLKKGKRYLSTRMDLYEQSIKETVHAKEYEISSMAESRSEELEWGNEIVAQCVKKLDDFPVSFDKARSEADVYDLEQRFKRKLEAILNSEPDLGIAIKTLGFPGIDSSPIHVAFNATIATIDQMASERKVIISHEEKGLHFLDRMGFLAQLSKAHALETAAEPTRDPLLKRDAKLAGKFCELLDQATDRFLHSKQMDKTRLLAFAQALQDVLSDGTLSHLMRQHNWRPIVQELTKTLNFIKVTPSIDPIPTGKGTHAIKRDESDGCAEKDRFRPR